MKKMDLFESAEVLELDQLETVVGGFSLYDDNDDSFFDDNGDSLTDDNGDSISNDSAPMQ